MAPRVVVVGLGPGDPGLISQGALAAIERIPMRFVRTQRHPSAPLVGAAATFDRVYERAQSLDEVYRTIVDELAEAALTARGAEVLYAVPGSPLVAERTVELLRADTRVEVEIIPSLSFLDLAWARLGVDPFEAGVRLVDGHRFAVEAAGQSGPLLVAQCDSQLVLSDIKLAVTDGGGDVVVLQRLGLPDEAVTTVGWDDLDRAVRADHLTCLWIGHQAEPVAAEIVRFAELVRTLREHCPWDRRQTHRSLARHLLEETYEVLDAIDALPAESPERQSEPEVLECHPAGTEVEGAATVGAEDGFAHLEEELGDLLFQVVFHSTLAAEEGQFSLADVARGIHDKLVRRHPHVFGTVDAGTAEIVAANWEQIKKAEKGRASLMDGVPPTLPALLYAHKVQRKAASVGFDWDGVAGAWPKIAEEAAELAAAMTAAGREVAIKPGGAAADAGAADPAADPGAVDPVADDPLADDPVADELGDLLFAVVNVARHLDVDPEAALRAATAKFARRFRGVEALADERGLDLPGLDLSTLDRLWDEVKHRSRRP